MDVRQELEREFNRLLARLQAETDDAETHAALRALIRVARACETDWGGKLNARYWGAMITAD